jgi:7-carboxy-7-deazaguanine synthase
MLDLIDVNEIFGPTVQGEGAAAGRHCLFLRLANCNLECTWCDTPYTWAYSKTKMDKHISAGKRSGEPYDKAEEIRKMSPEQVYEALIQVWDIISKPTIIVISGGEPMMQQFKLIPLLEMLRRINCEVHIETAGTIMPHPDFDRYVTQYNVSPKLQHSGNVLSKRYKKDVLKYFASCARRAWFKFVVMPYAGMDGQDFWEIDSMVTEIGINPRHVMIMPEGNNIQINIDGAQSWAQMAIDRGYGISFRTHILLWPKVNRGR